MTLLSPCCRASSWWPGRGIWASGPRGRWSKGRHGLASRGSCVESAWSSALPASSSQTACRCSPPPAGSYRTDVAKRCHFTHTNNLICCQQHPHTHSVSPLLFVHLVSKAHGVDHGEAQSHVTLLQIVGLSSQLHLRLEVGRLEVLKVRVEQRVHQGGFADTSFTWGQKPIGNKCQSYITAQFMCQSQMLSLWGSNKLFYT